MFRVSRHQLKSLADLKLQQYQRRLIAYICEYFPGHSRYLGNQGILRIIRRSCDLAEGHGFETERDICLYTNLTLMLGSGFDSDPQLEWAPEILHDPILVDPMSRMDALWEQAMLYLDRVLGPAGVLPKRAYRMARGQQERWHRTMRMGKLTTTHEENLISYFYDIWPEKAVYVGAPALRTLVGAGKETAGRHGVLNGAGQAEFLIHAFVFGHIFHADPQFPWAEAILKDKQIFDEEERMVRMAAAFDEQLKEILA